MLLLEVISGEAPLPQCATHTWNRYPVTAGPPDMAARKSETSVAAVVMCLLMGLLGGSQSAMEACSREPWGPYSFPPFFLRGAVT